MTNSLTYIPAPTFIDPGTSGTSPTGQARTVTIHTDSLVISVDGSNATTFFGTSFRTDTTVTPGVMTILVQGDLNIPSGSTITVTGSRPLSIQVANNVTIGQNVIFNASATAAAPGPGGGTGGTAGGGGGGGSGGGGGDGGSYGSRGFHTSISNSDAARLGDNGGQGDYGTRGNAGNAGAVGAAGTAGFNNATGAGTSGGQSTLTNYGGQTGTAGGGGGGGFGAQGEAVWNGAKKNGALRQQR